MQAVTAGTPSWVNAGSSRQLVAILRQHRKRQLEEKFKAGKDWKKTDLVFTTEPGRPIELRNMNRIFAALCKKTGNPLNK
ncbi:hypothetical protein ABIA39_008368 [Nocardia sp. GAS34]|uniref:hypothetical protein n=1 Tax=unclassified Nocardia TaxID=2637762 RepID=UPI003D1AB20A